LDGLVLDQAARLVLATFAASGPCAGLPLTPGTSWTYRADVSWAVSGSDSARQQTLSWTTSVLAVRTSDSAVAATVQGWPTDLAWWEPGRVKSVSVIYCTRGQIYQFHPPAEAVTARVTSPLAGSQQPTADDLILRFPLHAGQSFGGAAASRSDALYAWFVEAAESLPSFIRRLRPSVTDSLYTLAYRTNPDHTTVGFVPGLGIVRYSYTHHGTTASADAWLAGYHEGRPPD
jgi:hypothetical protein